MKIVFAVATSKLPSWLDELSGDYVKKISFWFPVEVKNVSTKKSLRCAKLEKINQESKSFLEYIQDSDFVIVCDERGTQVKSLDFAKAFERTLHSGKKRLVFIIGGAYGVSEELKKRADWTLGLGTLTLNHHIALAMLMEQVYRGLTIIKGVAYHNE